jgi:HK97 family phage prohead protease
MSKTKKYDFSGYATKVGLKCTDGRTILPDAFADADGKTVPLVYQHMHNDPQNVLGHAVLENRKDGVYAYCSLNDTEAGKTVKALIQHGDISALSIYANSLVEKAKNVIHGVIREVSIVLAGANPGAYIDNIAFEHGDGSISTDETEAIICAGAMGEDGHIKEEEEENEEEVALTHADKKNEETVGDIFETLTEKQKTVVYAMIAHALESSEDSDVEHGDDSDDDDTKIEHSNKREGDSEMKKNIFDKTASATDGDALKHEALTREELRSIFNDARQSQSTLKNAFLAHGFASLRDALSVYEHREDVLMHASNYGVGDNVEYLFPDAQASSTSPAFIKRDTEWVSKVFGGAKHVPFSRIKTVLADITADEARARGYVKGNEKVDEVISLLKRTTDPQTVYKKQKLDRDDIIDITDFDVVIWLRAEMRMMLEEEIARAQIVGDGRNPASDDKIKEDKIRPIATDSSVYTVEVQIAESASVAQMIDQIILGRKQYKGTGNPTFFTTPDVNGDMLLLKDSTGRRLYNTEADLAAGLRAREIVEVPVMENKVVVITPAEIGTAGVQKRLVGVSVNMSDYSLGADKGGAVAMFDDFDIDFNQYKYLIETRCSGALTMPHSAIAYWKLEAIPALT